MNIRMLTSVLAIPLALAACSKKSDSGLGVDTSVPHDNVAPYNAESTKKVLANESSLQSYRQAFTKVIAAKNTDTLDQVSQEAVTELNARCSRQDIQSQFRNSGFTRQDLERGIDVHLTPLSGSDCPVTQTIGIAMNLHMNDNDVSMNMSLNSNYQVLDAQSKTALLGVTKSEDNFTMQLHAAKNQGLAIRAISHSRTITADGTRHDDLIIAFKMNDTKSSSPVGQFEVRDDILFNSDRVTVFLTGSMSLESKSINVSKINIGGRDISREQLQAEFGISVDDLVNGLTGAIKAASQQTST